MHSETIKYLDWNENEVSDTFYFNLTKPELADLQLSVDGGFANKLSSVQASNDPKTIIEIWKKFFEASYGVKSEDGKRFMKKDKDGHRYVDEFYETRAYETFFEKVCLDPEYAAQFIKNVLPKDLAEEAEKVINERIEAAKANA